MFCLYCICVCLLNLLFVWFFSVFFFFLFFFINIYTIRHVSPRVHCCHTCSLAMQVVVLLYSVICLVAWLQCLIKR